MAFVIFYNHQDLTAIAANVEATMASNYDAYFQSVQERNQVKQTFQRCWTGGLSGWSTSPTIMQKYPTHPEYLALYGDNDADCRAIEVSGPQVSLAGLVDALRIMGTRVPGAYYMVTIGNDLSRTGVEPPPAA